MVCPNCKSTDIITVQDQRFCIACGQILPLEKSPAAPKTAKAVPIVASTAPAAKRRKPGRPKASRLDAPKDEPAVSGIGMAKPTEVTAASTEKSVEIKKFASPVTAEPVVAVKPAEASKATPSMLPVGPAVAGAAAQRSRGRQLSDIAPKKPGAPKSDLKAGQDTTATPAGTPAKQQADTIHLEYGAVEAASLQGRFRPAVFHWSLIPAGLLAIVAGAITWVLVGNKAAQAWSITQQAGWPVWGELGLICVLFYLARSVGAAATVYGAARRADHRPTPASHQLAASVNSLGARVGFDAITMLLQLVVIALGTAVVIMGGAVWPIPEAVQITGLFLVYLVLGYLLAGLSLTQGLGRVALTLGAVSIWRAFGLGWNFFRHHFELVGFRFVSLLVELVLSLPLLAATAALVMFLPSQWRWLAPLAAVALALVGGVSYGAGTAVWWQAVYRRLVHHGQPGSALNLLTGRKPEKTQRGAAASLVILALLLGALATAWPWLPLP